MSSVDLIQSTSRKGSNQKFCDKDALRTSFALAMSAMYKSEVPQYGDLVRIVHDVNRRVMLSANTDLAHRLDYERHGAIRLGTAHELSTICRLFDIIGLSPVGYYDLSVAGLPMHATAFRPIEPCALSENPFRIFTTLLRPELLRPAPRQIAQSLLAKREIFSRDLLELVKIAETQGGLLQDQGEQFIHEAIQTFKWHSVAMATHAEYQILAKEHPILADIACFNSAHINHLTPRTLDIDLAEAQMKKEGLKIKSMIEGPPARKNAILLRQTSFLALQEQIKFPSPGNGPLIEGHHKARFGEIEQRGAAVTPEGRRLYDTVLQKARKEVELHSDQMNPDVVYQRVFLEYPDDWDTLVGNKLVFCEYSCTPKATGWKSSHHGSEASLAQLLNAKVIQANPITYEDFLPFSAAGIFRSNLKSDRKEDEQDNVIDPFEDRSTLELALGRPVLEPDNLYADIQARSLRKCAKMLGLAQIVA